MNKIIDDKEDFKEVRNKPDFVAYSKIGTDIDKEHIIMKVNFDLGNKYTIKDVIDVLVNVEGRATWDKAAKEYSIDKRYNDCLILKRYEIIIPMPFMQNREFVEKQIAFRSNNQFYAYSSSVNDSLESLKPTLTRAKTTICGSKITQEGDSIKIVMISQMDMKLFIPSFLLAGKMADEMEQFKENLIKEIERVKSL